MDNGQDQKKIGFTTTFLLLLCAGLVDITQIVLSFIPVPFAGAAIIVLIDTLFVASIISFFFLTSRLNKSNVWIIIAFLILELVPYIQAFSLWVLAVWFLIKSINSGNLSLPGLNTIKQFIGGKAVPGKTPPPLPGVRKGPPPLPPKLPLKGPPALPQIGAAKNAVGAAKPPPLPTRERVAPPPLPQRQISGAKPPPLPPSSENIRRTPPPFPQQPPPLPNRERVQPPPLPNHERVAPPPLPKRVVPPALPRFQKPPPLPIKERVVPPPLPQQPPPLPGNGNILQVQPKPQPEPENHLDLGKNTNFNNASGPIFGGTGFDR